MQLGVGDVSNVEIQGHGWNRDVGNRTQDVVCSDVAVVVDAKDPLTEEAWLRGVLGCCLPLD